MPTDPLLPPQDQSAVKTLDQYSLEDLTDASYEAQRSGYRRIGNQPVDPATREQMVEAEPALPGYTLRDVWDELSRREKKDAMVATGSRDPLVIAIQLLSSLQDPA